MAKKLITAALAGALMIVATAIPAFAQDPYGGGEPDDVKGIIIVKDPAGVDRDETVVGGETVVQGSTDTAPAVLPANESGVLPFTGSDLLLFVTLGGAAIVIGTTMVRRARER